MTPRKAAPKKRRSAAKKSKKKKAGRSIREVEAALAEEQRARAQLERANAVMSQLLKDLLSFARLETGRVTYDIQPVILLDVVTSSVEIMTPRIANAGLTCTATVDGSLVVAADYNKLQQILLNLISNAIKFTPSGGTVSLDVPVRPALPDDAVFLRVADTGCGIPRKKQELVFEPFVQAGRPVAGGMIGMGLGLPIGRDLARGMGGDLRVRSEPGKGSSFTLTLRRYPESD